MIHLFETRAGEVRPFEPAGQTVRMYTCGITPYDATHVGHAATFVAYDVVQRRLLDMGYETRYVRNITDVDDDILDRAAQLHVHYLDVAAAALATFNRDMEALNLLAPWSEPRATSAISDVRSFIGRVLDSGHAYVAEGSVFFDVSASAHFGELSGLDRASMLAAGSGVERNLAGRRDPLDFVLWQPSAAGEPTWTSRWGDGRPGWHVECAALSVRELGTPIDLHGGGTDLIYPHHECEQAQAEAATGTTFVRHWMHTAEVHLDGAKMAKSTGNLAFVADLRSVYDPMAIRLAILRHHYRTPWEWSDALVDDAQRQLDRWRNASESAGAGAGLDEVRACIDDDLDTPGAIDVLDNVARRGGSVATGAALLGLA